MDGEEKSIVNKYVLFGAGIMGTAAVNFLGKDNIVAVIDNNSDKVGTNFEGVKVISFDTYLHKYKDLQVIITIYSSHYFEVLEQLKQNDVNNYFTLPPVLYGFDTPEEMVEEMIKRHFMDVIRLPPEWCHI
jgi:NADH/NAD ratio-sensing transcriptional regulator Rex